MNSHPVGTLPYLLDKYNAYLLMSWAQCQIAYEADDSSKLGRYHTALRNAIEDKLDRLEHEGILEKVTHSEWATPIVAVPKPDGKVRLCGDFKVTVNQAMKVDQYPIPTAKNLCATLAGRKKFLKIDSSQAYLQMELDPESQKYCTINTHRGLYQLTFTRLPFGPSHVPENDGYHFTRNSRHHLLCG